MALSSLAAGRRRRIRRKADLRIAALRADLERLSQPRPAVGVRLAIRRSAGTALAAAIFGVCCWLLFTVASFLALGIAQDPSAEVHGIPPGFYISISLTAVAGWTHDRYRQFRQAAAVLTISQAVKACTQARLASNTARPMKLTALANYLADVEKAVLKARQTRQTVLLRSHRIARLRDHAGQVVARLREAEARLDTEPDEAFQELAHLLMTIAENYTAGRVGALLPETELTGRRSVRDRELIKLSIVVVLLVGVAIAAPLLGLPEGALLPVLAGVGILLLVAAFRRRYRQYLDLLPFLQGP
ncbi:hypothetical protein [Streptomyces sp. NBC_00893]|uniref:hypothetical protein n=1 Tax=Streptomyces sp. NBC_00893 TaxID=2975862 RepID=UPI002252973E|nr:hypothetical protein [Streptomyces sp. NBC_00893]MCX4846347.1 hypothetical protein [Streptomyces sp. NBC_00893]